MTDSQADNGVNLQARLDAREMLTADPAPGAFQWRASCTWRNGTHSHSVVHGFGGLGAEQAHRQEFHYDVDPLRDRDRDREMNVMSVLGGDPEVRNGFESITEMNRLLARLDEWARASCTDDEVAPPERFEATPVDERPLLRLPLGGAVGTVVFATGYRPDHSWLELPVLDRKGRLVHDGGVVRGVPGLYALGLPFLRRRRSTFIHGAEADTAELAEHLHRHLDQEVARSPL